MNIGFIGLGQMGARWPRTSSRRATNSPSGTVNRSPGKAKALVEAGAVEASFPAEAAGGELVITMLADDPAVEAVGKEERGGAGLERRELRTERP